MIIPRIEILPDGYRLLETYQSSTPITGYSLESSTWMLMPNGELVLKAGYPWDGPSGPAVDTPNTLMPSANHDCLCGMIEDGLLPYAEKQAVDQNYRGDLKNWGVSKWRRLLHFRGVRIFGKIWMDAK